jgi:hypothetical protein
LTTCKYIIPSSKCCLISSRFSVSGDGIICQCLYERRVKKLDDDLERVRELQGQLGVLRTVRAKRKLEAAKKAGDATDKETKGKHIRTVILE